MALGLRMYLKRIPVFILGSLKKYHEKTFKETKRIAKENLEKGGKSKEIFLDTVKGNYP